MRILLQTTIPFAEDDWHIARFSLLASCLRGRGHTVDCRDREPDQNGQDAILSDLPRTGYHEMWLFGADVENGLSFREVEGINAFRRRGGGLLTARDHQDLGLRLRGITQVGEANYFHRWHCEADPSRQGADDQETPSITWPNYRSGANGDHHRIRPTRPVHPVLRRRKQEPIEYFPAHPHEGAVGAEDCGRDARTIATATSQATGREFNLVVALEASDGYGRALAHSSFHHFADYNWDPRLAKPSFVSEPSGDGMLRDAHAAEDIRVRAALPAGLDGHHGKVDARAAVDRRHRNGLQLADPAADLILRRAAGKCE